MAEPLRILFLGDIVGRPGRRLVREAIPRLRAELNLDLILANGENASGGLGLSPECAQELHTSGVDVLTSGNHIWRQRSIGSFLDRHEWVLRPANYPPGAPGSGIGSYSLPSGKRIHVINLIGRTYMEQVDCPFRCVDEILQGLEPEQTILVDFHAEATSEKRAMGVHLQGRVSAVLGTHTHVQTADACILKETTAYMTDLGMCGPMDSVLGMDSEIIVRRFITGLPERFQLAKGEASLQGAVLEIDAATGRALAILRFCRGADEI